MVKGYGINICTSDEELRQFIIKHKATVLTLMDGSKIVEYAENTPPDEFNIKEEFYDWYNEQTDDTGIYGVISSVMKKETGFGFEYINGDEDLEVLIFPTLYPWQMTEKEKSLTEDELQKIFNKYEQELGIKDVPEDMTILQGEE